MSHLDRLAGHEIVAGRRRFAPLPTAEIAQYGDAEGGSAGPPGMRFDPSDGRLPNEDS